MNGSTHELKYQYNLQNEQALEIGWEYYFFSYALSIRNDFF